MGPEASDGILVAYPYLQELDNPVNQEFVEKWHAKFGDEYPYITHSAVAVWNDWHLWAAAVEKAGSLDRDKVIEALESGISIDSPSGTVTMDGPSHHVDPERLRGGGQRRADSRSSRSSRPFRPPSRTRPATWWRTPTPTSSSSRESIDESPRRAPLMESTDSLELCSTPCAESVALLVIISLGLAVVFGMMGVINLAHGEFLMLGAFLTLTGTRLGLPSRCPMLVGGSGCRAVRDAGRAAAAPAPLRPTGRHDAGHVGSEPGHGADSATGLRRRPVKASPHRSAVSGSATIRSRQYQLG